MGAECRGQRSCNSLVIHCWRLLDKRLDREIVGSRIRAGALLADEKTEDTSAVAGPNERFYTWQQLVADENLSPSAVTRLERRNNVVGVVKRLPMNGLFHRDWTPRRVIAH